MKKIYMTPTTEIIKFHTENSVAGASIMLNSNAADAVDSDDVFSSEDEDYEEDDWDE